jgi:hypothetical protein
MLLKKDINYKETWLEVAIPSLRQERKGTWIRCTSMGRMPGGMRKTMGDWLTRGSQNRN